MDNEKFKALKGEALAYIVHGNSMNPIRVEQMLNEAFKAGQQESSKLIRQFRDIQGEKGTYDYDEYMRGMYNGLELAVATIENKEPVYKEPPAQEGNGVDY